MISSSFLFFCVTLLLFYLYYKHNNMNSQEMSGETVNGYFAQYSGIYSLSLMSCGMSLCWYVHVYTLILFLIMISEI